MGHVRNQPANWCDNELVNDMVVSNRVNTKMLGCFLLHLIMHFVCFFQLANCVLIGSEQRFQEVFIVLLHFEMS